MGLGLRVRVRVVVGVKYWGSGLGVRVHKRGCTFRVRPLPKFCHPSRKDVANRKVALLRPSGF